MILSQEARLWFKDYEACAFANAWNDQKKLPRLPTLPKGCSWSIYNSLRDKKTYKCDHPKATILKPLCQDTEVARIVAQECLSQRVLH